MSKLEDVCNELNDVRGDTLELAETLVRRYHELLSAAAHARTTFTNDPYQASEAAKEFEQAAEACKTAAEHLNIAGARALNFINENCGSTETHIITVTKTIQLTISETRLIDSDGGWHGKDGEYLTPEQNAAADEFLALVKQAEPTITGTLQTIVENLTDCKLVDFDKRLKTEYSLKRKLAGYISDYPDDSMQECLSAVTDSVRYTVQIPDQSYGAEVLHVVDALYVRGYTAEIKEDNYWKNEKGYQGINSWWLSPHSRRCTFEVQFHTAWSFFAKTVTHPLYGEKRVRDQKINDVYAKGSKPDIAARIEIYEYLKRRSNND